MTGNKLSDGKSLGGKGRLTIARIDPLQNFYGLVIRNNKGNSEAMSKATMAILDHYEEDTLHDHCLPGKGSWYSFQRDAATGSSFHKPIKSSPLPDAVVKVIKPLFDRLEKKEFLVSVEKCRTQNVNESFHHIVWQYAPKDKVNSVNEINLALHLAVLVFNEVHGLSISVICKSVGIQFSQNILDQLNEIDSTRLYEKHRQSTEICGQRSKYVKR